MLSDSSSVSDHESTPVVMRAAGPHVPRAASSFSGVPRPVGHLLLLASLPAALLAGMAVPSKSAGPVMANRTVTSARQAFASAGEDTGQVPCMPQSRAVAGSERQPAPTTGLVEPDTDRTHQGDPSFLPGQRARAPTRTAQASPTFDQNLAPQPSPHVTPAPAGGKPPCSSPAAAPARQRSGTGLPHPPDSRLRPDARAMPPPCLPGIALRPFRSRAPGPSTRGGSCCVTQCSKA